VKLFGRGQQEREAERQEREQEAQRWLDEHNAEKQARAEVRAAQAGQPQTGGITHTGAEDISIIGQAFGHGAAVRNVAAGEAGGHGGRGRGDAGDRQPSADNHQGPLIVNTGGGQINVQKSAVGHNVHMINYGDRETTAEQAPQQAGRGLEAGQ
jgi:hypothetical protein